MRQTLTAAAENSSSGEVGVVLLPQVVNSTFGGCLVLCYTKSREIWPTPHDTLNFCRGGFIGREAAGVFQCRAADGALFQEKDSHGSMEE